MIYKQNPEVEARQDPPVRAEIDSLEKTVVFLIERLQVLEERLYSVLQEPRPTTDQIVKDMNGNSAMTRKIYQINTELRGASYRIESLIDRLEV